MGGVEASEGTASVVWCLEVEKIYQKCLLLVREFLAT